MELNFDMPQTLIIGGGVIGLSLAYELSRRRQPVTLLERERVGQKASWAGAGILPPTQATTAIHPLEKLEALSSELHAQWATDLRTQTGIDTGYIECGGVYLARSRGEIAALIGQQLCWQQRHIPFETLDRSQLTERVPGCRLEPSAQAVFVRGESQLRNPRHLQALLAACRQNGVKIVEGIASLELVVHDEQTESIHADGTEYRADQYCVACGAWSEQLLAPFQASLPMTPVRGQMALFKLPQPIFDSVINEGIRYLVPRADGQVLAGATIEEVGFDSDTVPADIAELVAWASELIPACNPQTLVSAWAGLRPGTCDGFPYLGLMGNSRNTWVATGHFKAGLHLSTGTAVVMADSIEGQTPAIDLAPFSPGRVSKC